MSQILPKPCVCKDKLLQNKIKTFSHIKTCHKPENGQYARYRQYHDDDLSLCVFIISENISKPISSTKALLLFSHLTPKFPLQDEIAHENYPVDSYLLCFVLYPRYGDLQYCFRYKSIHQPQI